MTLITRDAIFDLPRFRGPHGSGYVVQTDAGGMLDILNFADGIGYAHSSRTGLVIRFRVTGQVTRRNGMVRVYVQYPEDTGDVAGTLEFKDEKGQGGWISPDVAWSGK